MIYSGFTSGCLNRLETSRRKLNIFTDANKKRVDNILSDLQQLQSNEQQKIDSLLRQLKSLQYERGAVEKLKDSSSNNSADNGTGGGGGGGMAERRKKLESKQKKLEEEVSMLESRNRMEKQQLDGTFVCRPIIIYNATSLSYLKLLHDCSRIHYLCLKLSYDYCAEIMAEEAAVRKRADEVRKKKEEIEMARGITLEDLTIGLLNYRYTGLTFQTLQDGTLRCVCFSLHDRSKLASCLHIGTIILIQCDISYTASNLRNSTVTIHPDHSPSC